MVIDSRKMAQKIADEALDNFLYDGKTIREWMQMIVSGDYIPRQNIEAAIAEIAEKHSHTWITGEKFTNIYALDIIEIIRKHTKI